MFIPIGTDAPLYHYPYATAVIALANVACFIATGCGDPGLLEPWVLELGTINPIEWLTSMYSHAGFGHIIGNMIGLTIFGIIVEGKLGFRKMLVVYHVIGLAQAALIQLIMLGGDGGVLGASSAIFGLLAICLVWAPKNEISFFYFYIIFFFVRTGTLELTVMTVSAWYFGWDLLSWALFHGMGMSTPMLHITGAMCGFGVGVFMLKKDMVDCENWDLFRVMSGNYGRYADSSTTVGSHADPTLMFGKEVAVQDTPVEKKTRRNRGNPLEQINELIDSNAFMEAAEEMYTIQLGDSTNELNQKRLRRLSSGLFQLQMMDEAEIYLEEYAERFPDDGDWARVRLAQILLHHRQPSAALKTLKNVRLSRLKDDMKAAAKKTVVAAKKLVSDGAIDAEREW